jgi:hypothetical protein
MTRTRFEQKGLRDLRRKLDRMPREVKDGIKLALARSGDDLVKTMRGFVAVDVKNGGELRDTIEWYFPERKPDEPDLKSNASRLSIKGEQGLAIIVVAGASSRSGEDGFYGKWVEFGYTVKSSGRQMPGQPFFYPAYRLRKRSVQGRITRETNKAIKQVAGVT